MQKLSLTYIHMVMGCGTTSVPRHSRLTLKLNCLTSEGYMLQITATVSLSHCHSWQVLRKRLFILLDMRLRLVYKKKKKKSSANLKDQSVRSHQSYRSCCKMADI